MQKRRVSRLGRSWGMNRFALNGVVRRVATALMLSTAPFVAVERAGAACDQVTSAAAPINNTAVTCSGPTTDANPPNGWGTGIGTGDTITVQSGASVTSTSTITGNGLNVFDGTINNFGTVSSAAVGVRLNNGGTVNNSGPIEGTGDIGIFSSFGNLTVTN